MSSPTRKSASAALTVLLRTMPSLDAAPEERAAWFDRKADVLDLIAALHGPDAAGAHRLALHARAHAQLIRRGRAG
jgi:hypothetical protein